MWVPPVIARSLINQRLTPREFLQVVLHEVATRGWEANCSALVNWGLVALSKADNTVLEPGMILSNEPGYYKAGEYGIRIENLVVVREAEQIDGGDRPMHWLETITFAPIALAQSTAARPTPPLAPWISTHWPACIAPNSTNPV